VTAGLSNETLDTLNTRIVTEIQLSGTAVTSTARIGGKMAIRAAITNHRTTSDDLALLVAAVLQRGRAIAEDAAQSQASGATRRAA
jgi:aromatic-L-amino-acid/L-tryptophan decarboxylase